MDGEYWYEYLYYGDFRSHLATTRVWGYTSSEDNNWVQAGSYDDSYTTGGISQQSHGIDGYLLEIDTMTTTNSINTNPLQPDTDDDGLTDYEEVMTYPTDPLVADTDAEGLLDGQEINVHNTDPLVADTDGDGLTDYEEVVGHSTNPLLDADKDGDGLTDSNEVLNIGTDPSIMDTDGDGLSDDEVAMNGMTLIFDQRHSSNVISSIQGMISSTPLILNQSNSLMRTGGDELNINIRLQSSQDLIDGHRRRIGPLIPCRYLIMLILFGFINMINCSMRFILLILIFLSSLSFAAEYGHFFRAENAGSWDQSVTLNEGDRFVFLNCDYTSWPDGQMVEESFICNYYESNTVYRTLISYTYDSASDYRHSFSNNEDGRTITGPCELRPTGGNSKVVDYKIIRASEEEGGSKFTASLNSDGSRLAIGSKTPGSNAVTRVYEFNGTSWNQLGEDVE